MEEKDWLILKMLYEEKNITKTAEFLYISQPALTYRIQQLEKEFGTKIVSRGKKGVEFTSQGECLVSYAKKMLFELRKTKELIENMKGKVQGTVRLGVSSNFARYVLPILLKKFVEKYPSVEFNVKTGWSSEVLNMLYKDEVHIGILRGEHNWREQRHLLYREPICIVSKRKILLEDLPDLQRINYKTDWHLKLTIDQWWQKTFAVPPLITMEVDRIDTCVELVKNSMGYAIVPKITLMEQGPLYTIDICAEDNSTIFRETSMIYRDTSLDLSAVKAFVEFLKEEYEKSPD